MKIVFLQNDTFVKIAVMLLCAVLKKKGHDAEVLIESGESDFIGAVLKSEPELIAFSCTTGWEFWVQSTAQKLKEKSGAPVLVGGPHATFFPELINDPNIDYVCRGEGEEAIVELADALASGDLAGACEIPNICSKNPGGGVRINDVRPLVGDLDTLPFPDFSPYTKYRYLIGYNRDMYPVITGRGCPFNCSYCFNKAYKEIYLGKGKYVRRRSPGNVILELKMLKERYRVGKINFVDDSFVSSPRWLEEFAPRYIREIDLPFIINAEATQVKEELVRLLKKMGCICVRMGVETGSEKLRREILKKQVSDAHIRNAAALFKKYDIKLSTFNILGLPGETLELALETYRLNKEIRSDFIQCSFLQPYPGTDICIYVKENGYIDQSNSTVLEESYFVASQIRMENKKEIVNLQKLMQIMARLRAPKKVVLFFIRLPDNPLYSLMFKISFVLSKIWFQRIKLFPLIRMGMHSLGYMNKKTS